MNFKIATPVAMKDVPQPKPRTRRGQWNEVFDKISDLKRGMAMPIRFDKPEDGYYARGAMRKVAKAAGEFLSSSMSEDKLTFYFWIEPKETVAELKIVNSK